MNGASAVVAENTTTNTEGSGVSLYGTITAMNCPFKVKVSIPDLNIRKGAGTNYAKAGRYTGMGVFTIVEVKPGVGSSVGWGRLKSGAGWVSLTYCKRV